MPACAEAIDDATAQTIFKKLSVDAGEGCALETVDTERAEMRISWKKGADVTEPMSVVPAACGAAPRPGAKLAATVPSSTRAACPKSVEAALAFIEKGEVAPVAMTNAPSVPGAPAGGSTSPAQPVIFAVAGGVAILAVAVVFAMRRGKKPSAP
jgi:hypothetical protein